VAIIISLPLLGFSGLLKSHASICVVFPKTFIHFVGNGEFGIGVFSGAFKEYYFFSLKEQLLLFLLKAGRWV
jgi:hypothetical protein